MLVNQEEGHCGPRADGVGANGGVGVTKMESWFQLAGQTEEKIDGALGEPFVAKSNGGFEVMVMANWSGWVGEG